LGIKKPPEGGFLEVARFVMHRSKRLHLLRIHINHIAFALQDENPLLVRSVRYIGWHTEASQACIDFVIFVVMSTPPNPLI
jgi:hypothetical protein